MTKNISITLNSFEIEKLKHILSPYEISSNNDYVAKMYKLEECTLTLYKTSVFTIQGNNAENVYYKIFGIQYKSSDNRNQDALFEHKIVNQNYVATMGSDEVGVGDFFGGIVVVAAYVKPNQIEWLKDIGVTDSKKLSDDKIQKIYEEIKDIIPFSIQNIEPIKYNELFNEYGNSHVIKAICHNQCLWDLSKRIQRPYFVIIDEFASSHNYSNYLRQASKTEYTIDIFETKAESKYYCVACASIIARVHFLEQIKNLSKEIGINLPLGSSNYEIKEIGKKIIETKGINTFDSLVKKHFSTYDEIIGE